MSENPDQTPDPATDDGPVDPVSTAPDPVVDEGVEEPTAYAAEPDQAGSQDPEVPA